MLGDAGFEPVESPTLSEWEPGRHGLAVIVDIGFEGALAELAAFSDEHPHIPVIAVLEMLNLASYAGAIRSGASAALAENDPIETMVSVLAAALEGRSAVPFEVIRSMAARIPAAPEPSAWVTEDEAEWLKRLATGDTVARLANHAGYSEREMFRLLNSMYLRIGVSNRTEAIVWAARHGVLDEETD